MHINIRTDSNEKYQVFEGIGASGAWWAQEVGGWEDIDELSGIAVRDRIAELLYSKEKGIGMRTYRYNIGGGSRHSDVNDIENPLRKTESFDDNGSYDFSRDANAVYMMKKAAENGAEEIILFVNSPVERLTKNHKSHCDKSKIFRDNLSRDNYKAFADYCLDVTEHFVKEGLPVKYLSPVNEPVWIWVGGQEGCHYSPVSAGMVMEVFAQELKKRPLLKDVKLSGVESGDLRWFNKSYTREMLKHKDVLDVTDSVDVHSYFLPLPVPFKVPFLGNRLAFVRRFRRWMDRRYPGMDVKISEWCHMQGGRDKTMDSAMVTANIMYEDITLMRATSWQHWIAVSEVDYCDGLIYINLDDRSFEMTKRYYVTGNFSKYIPYGARRIKADCPDEELRIIAFEKDGRQTVIIINNGETEKTVSLPGFCEEKTIAVTDKDNDLEEYKINSGCFTVTPKSVNTVF